MFYEPKTHARFLYLANSKPSFKSTGINNQQSYLKYEKHVT